MWIIITVFLFAVFSCIPEWVTFHFLCFYFLSNPYLAVLAYMSHSLMATLHASVCLCTNSKHKNCCSRSHSTILSCSPMNLMTLSVCKRLICTNGNVSEWLHCSILLSFSWISLYDLRGAARTEQNLLFRCLVVTFIQNYMNKVQMLKEFKLQKPHR